ncbi:hypothetical protein PMAYCL1PPCAC_05538, partial [Pristionchus mayeri]
KLESGTGVCACLPSLDLALPIIFAILSAGQTSHFVIQLIMLTTNFPIFMSMFFVEGLIDTGVSLSIIKMILAITPARQRSSALTMRRLLYSVTVVPAPQILAAISDYLRGDSIAPADRLVALQKTFLYTWGIPLSSTALCFVQLRFYKGDLMCAKKINETEKGETSPLIGGKSD